MPKTSVHKSRKAGRLRRKNARLLVIMSIVAVIILISAGAFFLIQKGSITTSSQVQKPIILYVNQGNALVDTSNYTRLLNFAKANGFNTIFFQIYRTGNLLFSESNLTYFVSVAHDQNLKIFFALYFTSANQQIPTTIYSLGEDGINLDMSLLSDTAQSNLLATVQQNFKHGLTAVTTNNFGTTLKPNLLILETYESSDQTYIHFGIIASVEPLASTSKQGYLSQFQYALSNSDGVMVFDYYGLLKTGY